jgi:hypothetical protein
MSGCSGKRPAAHPITAPGRLTYDGAGNLYVTDAETVRKIVLATAAVTTVVGRTAQTGVLLGPLPASLNMAAGVAWLPNQGLAISDSKENVVVIGRGL